MAKEKSIIVYKMTDPSHGWIRVYMNQFLRFCEKEDLLKISSCSYYYGQIMYLEEDCDAKIFTDAVEAKGYKINWVEIHTNRASRIRKCDHIPQHEFNSSGTVRANNS